MNRYTELKNMSLEDLASVVSAWPWFGTAQKLLILHENNRVYTGTAETAQEAS